MHNYDTLQLNPQPPPSFSSTISPVFPIFNSLKHLKQEKQRRAMQSYFESLLLSAAIFPRTIPCNLGNLVTVPRNNCGISCSDAAERQTCSMTAVWH